MVAVRVSVEILTVETGLWCNTCALPSGLRVWYVTSTGCRSTLRSKLSCDDAGDQAGHDVAADA